MSELESLRYLREVCATCTLAHPGRKADASTLTQQPSHSHVVRNCLKRGNFPNFCPLVNFNYIHHFNMAEQKPVHRY